MMSVESRIQRELYVRFGGECLQTYRSNAARRWALSLQREGRIERQGNMFFEQDPEGFEIEMIRYSTKQTYDARMWQTIEVKANGIEQFRNGDSLTRTIDDISGSAANAAEMKAAATGNELIFMQVQLVADLKKMEAVYSNFQRSQHQLESRISTLEDVPEKATKEISRLEREIEHRNKHTMKESVFAANGNLYGAKQREALTKVVAAAMKKSADSKETKEIGQYRGFNISVETSLLGKTSLFHVEGCAGKYQPTNLQYSSGETVDINGFIQRLDNYMGKFEKRIETTQDDMKHKAEELIVAKASRGQAFPQMDMLEALRQDNRDVIKELRQSQNDSSHKSTWEPSTGQCSAPCLSVEPGTARSCESEAVLSLSSGQGLLKGRVV